MNKTIVGGALLSFVGGVMIAANGLRELSNAGAPPEAYTYTYVVIGLLIGPAIFISSYFFIKWLSSKKVGSAPYEYGPRYYSTLASNHRAPINTSRSRAKPIETDGPKY